jgi:hypothetical protein
VFLLSGVYLAPGSIAQDRPVALGIGPSQYIVFANWAGLRQIMATMAARKADMGQKDAKLESRESELFSLVRLGALSYVDASTSRRVD